MGHELPTGQKVRIREGVAKYGGLAGEIIHREWIKEDQVYRRENPEGRAGEGRLALVVRLENPTPGLEPVILCYSEDVLQTSSQ